MGKRERELELKARRAAQARARRAAKKAEAEKARKAEEARSRKAAKARAKKAAARKASKALMAAFAQAFAARAAAAGKGAKGARGKPLRKLRKGVVLEEQERASKEAARVIEVEQKLREEPKGSLKRRGLDAEKKRIAKERFDRELENRGLPVGSPKERKESADRRFRSITDPVFRKLLREAIRTGQSPGGGKVPRLVQTKISTGIQRRFRVADIITEKNVEEILYRTRRLIQGMLPGKYSLWLAQIAFSGMGEYTVGSGVTMLVSDHPQSHLFQAQGYDSSGTYETWEGMLFGLERTLDDYVKKQRTVVYLHWVNVMNISRKG